MASDQTKVSKQYDVWSKVYDRTFKPLVSERVERAVQELGLRPGDRVLDLGTGTGLTLDHLPHDVRVVGLDISAGMLARAARKITKGGLRHVSLVQGDAMNPPLAERSFDHVLITHVISVVPDPVRVLCWAERLLRPGGRIVLTNHFKSTKKGLGALGKMINPLCMQLGWRSDLELDALVRRTPLRVARQFKLKKLDLWSIVVLTREADPRPDSADEGAEELVTAPPIRVVMDGQ